MTKNFYFNKEFFDTRIVGYDHKAGLVNDGSFFVREFYDIDPFIRHEMICVFHIDKPVLLEIKDALGALVAPFRFKAQTLTLCPWFFGKGLSLYLGETKILDLDVSQWREHRRPIANPQ